MKLAFVEILAAFGAAVTGALALRSSDVAPWNGIVPMVLRTLPLVMCAATALYYTDLYDLRLVHRFSLFARRLPQTLVVFLVLLVGFYAAAPAAKMTPEPFVASVIALVATVTTVRAIAYRFLRRIPFVERVLILGTGPLVDKLVEELQARPGYAVVGVADPAALSEICDIDLLIDASLPERRPDRVIVALKSRRGKLPVLRLLDYRVRGVQVEDGVELYERLTGKLAIEAVTPSSLLFSRDFRASGYYQGIARAISLLAAVLGLVLGAPLFALIAFAVAVDSRGPVFFLHDRVGRDGRRFRLIKFRTMHPDEHPPSEWVCDNDERITRVGRWIRRFRLDELPQFVNVLKGDLNLVGPRPHPTANVDLFLAHIPYYSLRNAARPGITGWAQVRYGYANNLEEETEKMRYDLYYIKHMSLWLDLWILFDTVKIVLLGREGAGVSDYRTPATMRA